MPRLRLTALCWGLAACFPFLALAQDDYEDVLETERETTGQSEILERLSELRQHPLDLRRATAADLQQIPWITPLQSQQIVQYRNTSGIQSLSDLLHVPGMDRALLERLSPFLTVATRKSRPSVSGRLLARVVTGELLQQTEEHPFLLGDRVLFRSEVHISDKMTVRLLTEKDPGERRLNDYIACSAVIRGCPAFDQMLLGHYRLDFGQGLVLGDYAGSFTGSAFPATVKKRACGPQACTSTFEAGPFFGLACSGSRQSLVFSLFASKARLDATLNDDGTVSSVYESGLHRTQVEQAKKDVLEERLLGGHVSLETGGLGRVGATFFASRFDCPFQTEDEERRRYEFQGRDNAAGGLHFDLYFRRFNLFGEAASSSPGGTGVLLGGLIDSGDMELDVVFRDYARDFFDRHNYGFARDPDATQNERGVLLGFQYKPDTRTRLKAYVDRWTNPWRRYYEKVPPRSEEFWSQAERQIRDGLLLTVRLALKAKEVDEASTDGGSKNIIRRQVNGRGQLDWQWRESIRWRGRLEHVRVAYPAASRQEQGWLFFADLKWILWKKITLENRLAWFRTASYDSRVYMYESDLPGAMTNLGCSGDGLRWYIVARGKPSGRIQMSLKYSVTRFKTPGRGDDHRLGVQLECNPNL